MIRPLGQVLADLGASERFELPVGDCPHVPNKLALRLAAHGVADVRVVTTHVAGELLAVVTVTSTAVELEPPAPTPEVAPKAKASRKKA